MKDQQRIEADVKHNLGVKLHECTYISDWANNIAHKLATLIHTVKRLLCRSTQL